MKIDPDKAERVAIDGDKFERTADTTLDRAAVIRAHDEAHAADRDG
ncbi:MAG: hypothetical protein ACRDWD_05940 [Acidimicrobiia bacterium]